MSRRDQIKMSDEEVDAFLRDGRLSMGVATVRPTGRVDLVAMWYGFFPDGALGFWTYGKSQKVLNLRRDPRLTVLVESGDAYDQLRGVEIAGQGVVSDSADDVMTIGLSVFERYTGPPDDAARGAVAAMGAKRVAVRIDAESVVSWDHRKLGGRY